MKDLNERFMRLASLWLANIYCESFLYPKNDSEVPIFSATGIQ